MTIDIGSYSTQVKGRLEAIKGRLKDCKGLEDSWDLIPVSHSDIKDLEGLFPKLSHLANYVRGMASLNYTGDLDSRKAERWPEEFSHYFDLLAAYSSLPQDKRSKYLKLTNRESALGVIKRSKGLCDFAMEVYESTFPISKCR